MKPTFFGQTRYSLFIPDSAAWRASSRDGRASEEYKRYLYDPDRLDFRDKIFNELTVPALADAAENHDVWHIVSYSESLPEKYVESLERTAEKFPFIVLQELPDGVADWGRSEAIIKQKLGSGVFGRYRLDDDDVLSKHYFDVVERFVGPEYVGMVVSLPLGVEALYSNGHFFNFREAHVPMNSMGMLYVSELHQNGTIRSPRAHAHDKADRFAPVIMDASGIGYLRTNHGGQDNMLRHRTELVSDRLVTNMDKFPALQSTDLVRESFPAIASIVLNDADAATFAWGRTVGNGLHVSFDEATRGLTVTVSGEAPQEIRKHPLALSLELETPSGRKLASRARLKGLATSANPAIGQFVYFDIKPGRFTASASAFLADGIKIKSAKLVPLVPEASDILLDACTVDHESSGANLSPLSPEAARAASFQQQMREQARRFGIQVWPRLRPVLSSILGVERTNRITELGAAKLR
ncbi:glycosyltransferase [Corynebacterium afermentans]|uniref:glycosyltransferase n=1 Tax=Corynebacterium afermentans TaxID=38286 RepID=UPI002573402F|nr:glycosyltransferase [Corynebacterium afermentans]